jgi:hypothetical protein
MTQSLKAIGVFIITLVAIGAVMNYFGLPRSGNAESATSNTAFAVSISPEELTRNAAPMPVQKIENYQ